MTKFNLAIFDSNKTLQENADKIGVCYNYMAEIARDNNLPYRRKKHGRKNKEESCGQEIFLPFRPDKPAVNDGQFFGGEGCD